MTTKTPNPHDGEYDARNLDNDANRQMRRIDEENHKHNVAQAQADEAEREEVIKGKVPEAVQRKSDKNLDG